MYGKLIKNDIRKNKLITAVITAFIIAAAMLTSLAVSLAINLSGAINTMLISARSVHFLQMHTGSVDMDALRHFADTNANVDDFQVLPFLNIDGADIVISGSSLAASVQDNGLSVQSDKFDFLLGLDGEIIRPSAGEIYVPIHYMKEGSAELGDTVMIHNVSFTVAGFLRDSLMNAALVSSKRFLVGRTDFEKVRAFGNLESLIEFRLQDDVSVAEFETAYLNAGLPANGPPAISYAQIRLLNGITDGIMIAVLALIVVLVIIVAFLCIRFTLLAKIEDDYKEIGVLKALGMRVSHIKKLYLAKYGLVAGFACAFGFLLSLPLQTPFMQNMRLYMGESGSLLPGLVFGFLGALTICGIVLLYVYGVLRRFRKIHAAQAVRFGAPQEKAKTAKFFRLSDNRLFSRNIFLGIRDVLSRKKLYITMLLVIVISSFIMIVPQNISSTVSADSFITYMGVGICDATIGVMRTQTDDVSGGAARIAKALEQDGRVEKYTVLINMMFDMRTDDGTVQRMRVDLGDHAAFPIVYSRGRAPEADTEIAISNLYADELSKTIGDEIVLLFDGTEKCLTVCGVYSDITNGGRTSKAVFKTNSGDVLGTAIPLAFYSQANTAEAIAQYREQFPAAKIVSIDEYIRQMFGPTLSGITNASAAAIGASILLTMLVTVLFLKMLVVKDRHPIAILKSMGCTCRDIQRQYLTRSVVVLVLGIVIGTILANTVGEGAGVAIVSSFGATTFHFVVNPWFAYAVSPFLLAGSVCAAALFGVRSIRVIKISDHIKEF